MRGHTVSNAVIALVTTGGEICAYVCGAANILVDVNGYHRAN